MVSGANDSRIKAGLELIAARRLVDSGEIDLPWETWCAHHIKRSQRDIRRVMALARAADPRQAREDEKARNRNVRPAGSRAATAFQALEQGMGAFIRGVREDDCPYTRGRRRAEWRKGWVEMQSRTDASPPVAPSPAPQTAQQPASGLRQFMQEHWALLSRADQELFIEWCTQHMADRPISAEAQQCDATAAKREGGRKVPIYPRAYRRFLLMQVAYQRQRQGPRGAQKRMALYIPNIYQFLSANTLITVSRRL